MRTNPRSSGGTQSATLMFMPRASLKGRGTVWAIEHRFTSQHHESIDDGWGTLEQAAREEAVAPATQIIEQRVQTILSGNESPDIPFDLSINPYRGCEHGCVYCFARPTHSYLNLSPGLDFETKIIAKVNAAERLHEALAAPNYEALPLNIGSATDAYQPAERRLRITRSLIEVLAEHRHPSAGRESERFDGGAGCRRRRHGTCPCEPLTVPPFRLWRDTDAAAEPRSRLRRSRHRRA